MQPSIFRRRGVKVAQFALLALLIVGPVLSACSQPTPTATPLPSATGTVQPDATPTAEPTQIPLPPTVVAVQPERGEEQLLDAPIMITFDQPMDAASTKAAFRIVPEQTGTVEVTGSTLLWKPGKPLARATRYDVTLAGAKASNGLEMNQPVAFRFVTVGYLEVTSTQPSRDAQEVNPETPILVVFNRPVVPLTSVDQQTSLPQPLVITPTVSGTGRWINTSSYSFRPNKPLAAGITYSVTVSTSVTDTTGSVLSEPYAWSFSTASPLVEHTQPESGLNNIEPTRTFSVTFSQPMDRAATEKAFSLKNRKGNIAGKFKWTENSQELNFKPDQSLAFGDALTMTVTTDALAASGVGKLRTEFKAVYRVVPLPSVLKVEPENSAKNVNPVGAVQIYFTGAISEATLVNALSIAPIVSTTQVLTYFNSYDNRLFVTWPQSANTTYTVTLRGTVGDNYGNKLGKDYVLSFRTGDYRPFVQLNVAGPVGTYNAYTKTVASILHRNVTTVDLTLYQLRESEFMRLTGTNSWEAQRSPGLDPKNVLRKWSIKPPAERNKSQVWFEPLVQENGQPLASGLYYLTVTSPEVTSPTRDQNGEATPPGQIIAISKYNVTLKASAADALVWVTDLKSGQPVANLPVRLVDEKGGALANGTGNADGVYTTTFPVRDAYQPLFAFVGKPGEADFAVANTRWTDGLDAWNFGLIGETYMPKYNAYLYTDRPIYRPGQTVYFKGIVRIDNDSQYALPDLKEVPVVITDMNGNEILRKSLPLNPLGTFNGEFKLDAEAPLGYHSINVQINPNYGTSVAFQVAEYRKPEYEMTVVTDKPEYRQGDVISVTAQANYFFGGAVKNAKVRWTLFSSDTAFEYKGEGNYSFSDITSWERVQTGPYGERIGEGTGVTDAQGRFTFSVPAKNAKAKQSQRFMFDVIIADANNQEVAGNVSATVHWGDFYVGVGPEEYVALVGKPTRVNLITVDPQSQPAPNTKLDVVVSKAEWFSVQERDDSGRYFWTSKVKETPVFTQTVTTATDGKAQLNWTAQKGGQYLVRATATDSQKRVIRSAAFLWVSSNQKEYVSWRRENNDRLELVADKKSYKPGDTARILIPSPYQGDVVALVTSERGRIYNYKLVKLTSNSTTLELPVLPVYAPDIFFSAVLVKGQDATNELASFKVGYTPQLPISTERQQVGVTITPSATKLGPRDTVSFTVQTRDYMSKPISAEVSLALVDKAVLSLADSFAMSMLETFYRQRGLGVFTAASLVLNIDRINQQQARGTKGGGGGGDGGPLLSLRSEFPDNAFWRADVLTDAQGQATVSVKLPDNLTTWRMLGKAVTADTRVGEAVADVQVTRPLLVRPVLPRFFVAGDQAEIAAVVNNNTDAPQKTTVSLNATGLELAAAPQQTVEIPAQSFVKVRWNVTVQPGDETTVKFVAEAEKLRDAVEFKLPVYRYTSPEVVGTSGQVEQGVGRLESLLLPPNAIRDQGELLVKLEPSLAAGMQSSLSYLEHFPYECTEQTLSRFLPNVLTYRALKQLGTDRPDLEKSLPTLTSVGLQRLFNRQNVDGGWGWWPGESSNPFVSAYVVFGLLKAREASVPVDQTVINRGVRFLERQLKAAKDLQGYELNQQAFLLYVLAEAGRGSVSRTVALYDAREKLANYGKAYLALALASLDAQSNGTSVPTPAPLFTSTITVTVPTATVTPAGQPAATATVTSTATALPEPTRVVSGSLRTRANTLMDDLRATVVESASGAHWEEKSVDYWTMNTDTRSTAIVLDAFAKLRPQDPVAPNIVRWLMTVRKAGTWETTQEAAWSLLALTDWMVSSGELKGDYSYRVTLNGNTLGEGAVTPKTVDQAIELRRDVTDMFRTQANALAFDRFSTGDQSGDGRLYYSSQLRYFLPADQIQARDRGISIQREYRLARCDSANGKPCPLTTEANVGDVINVKLTIVAPNDLNYVVIEDALPAGAEAVDTSLKTTTRTAEGPELAPQPTTEDGWLVWLPSHSELRDEKVALFTTYLPRGTYTYTYQMRASLPGRFLTLPASGHQMYFPDVWGRSDGVVFTVKEP